MILSTKPRERNPEEKSQRCDMEELEQEILSLAKIYFQKMDAELEDDFLLLLIQSAIDEYKMRRAYPSYYTDEMIEADMSRYFGLHKKYIAMEVIPELYGRVGGEGLSMLTDAGTTRMWKNSTLYSDVVPICEVI